MARVSIEAGQIEPVEHEIPRRVWKQTLLRLSSTLDAKRGYEKHIRLDGTKCGEEKGPRIRRQPL
jgi:hypothetical protein